MSADNLDALSDAALDEIFAVEVAGWTNIDTYLGRNPLPFTRSFRGGTDDGLTEGEDTLWHEIKRLPNFTTDANAVLPWLEKQEWSLYFDQGEMNPYILTIEYPEKLKAVEAPTFARAAVLALIRAKRNTK